MPVVVDQARRGDFLANAAEIPVAILYQPKQLIFLNSNTPPGANKWRK